MKLGPWLSSVADSLVATNIKSTQTELNKWSLFIKMAHWNVLILHL